jgi:hypothetical protein
MATSFEFWKPSLQLSVSSMVTSKELQRYGDISLLMHDEAYKWLTGKTKVIHVPQMTW